MKHHLISTGSVGTIKTALSNSGAKEGEMDDGGGKESEITCICLISQIGISFIQIPAKEQRRLDTRNHVGSFSGSRM